MHSINCGGTFGNLLPLLIRTKCAAYENKPGFGNHTPTSPSTRAARGPICHAGKANHTGSRATDGPLRTLAMVAAIVDPACRTRLCRGDHRRPRDAFFRQHYTIVRGHAPPA